MAIRHIMFDKTEIICVYPTKKKYKKANLTYDDIVRIQFDKTNRLTLFGKKPTEKITIVTGKLNQPIEYFQYKEKAFFDEYKQKLEEFAKRNHITFISNLEKEAVT